MSRRRGRYNPLQPVNELRWLVLRNRMSEIDADWPVVQLLAYTDSTEALAAGRQRLIDDGCTMDEIKPLLAFVFGWRNGERICLHIEALRPGSPTVGHGTFLGSRPPDR